MPYTYLIGWSTHNKFYYGARWAKDCSPDTLWTSYFTSSKHVKAFRKLCGEPDIIQIRKIFNDINKCRIHERKVLERLNVLKDDKWLNKNINGLFLPTGPQTEEHIAKRVCQSIETMRRNETLHKPTYNSKTHPEVGKKISKSLTGKPKSLNHIANMRFRPQDVNYITCPYCSKTGDYKNMKRWHMDNCKNNPNVSDNIICKNIVCNRCGYIAKQSPNFFRYHNKNCKI
jgi:hypothetical protein